MRVVDDGARGSDVDRDAQGQVVGQHLQGSQARRADEGRARTRKKKRSLVPTTCRGDEVTRTKRTAALSLAVPLLAALLATGCAAKKPAPALAPPAAPLPEGTTRYSYIFDPGNPALALPEGVQFRRPLPQDTRTLPKYPENALAANDSPHREVVRFIIDTHGNVGEIVDSPMERSDGGPFAADYRRAVEEALRTWRYEPGVFQHVKPGEDKDGDGKPDYKIMTSSEMVPVYYDVRFTFEIVDGKGVVKQTP